ncbi:MAG: transposase [Planctomycetaceae bacterium]
MSQVRAHKAGERTTSSRRQYTEEFKEEAVRMVLDGHSVASVCERLGLSGPNVLYTWKRKLVAQGGATAVGLEARVRELEAELRRVERERDILKKALAIFGRDE